MNLENRTKSELLNDELKKDLQSRGLEPYEVTTIKNGVPCTGITFRGLQGNVSPVIYYSEDESIEAFHQRLFSVIDAETPAIDVNLLRDWSYVREHVYPAVHRCGSEDIIKRNYLNLEAYLRIELLLDDKIGTVKILPWMLDCWNVSEDELWEAAMQNGNGRYHIRSMSEMLGIPGDDAESMYVATTDEISDGAAAILFPELFHRFCEEHGEQALIILPSSTQEMMVIPESALSMMNIDAAYLAQMVHEINEAQVEPRLQLQAAVYRFSLDTDEITVLAVLDQE